MKNQKKLFPDLDGPKYGIPFKVIGFQAQTIKGKYTELIKTEPKKEITLKNRREYLAWKNESSKIICESFNRMLSTKWDKIVSFKIEYFLNLGEEHYI